MSTTPHTDANLSTSSAINPLPVTPPQYSIDPATPFLAAGARGNGKVARLPKVARDQICHLLADGVRYRDIIQRLGDYGQGLKPAHLSEFKKHGYQDWLLQQAWLDQTRARQEPATGLAGNFDATQLSHGALQLATLQIFEALRDLGMATSPGRASVPASPISASPLPPSTPDDGEPAAPNQKLKIKNQKSLLDFRLGGDSAAFVRLIHALARASRETVLVQKYRELCTAAHAALAPLNDPDRDLTEEETLAIVRRVDRILGFEPSASLPDHLKNSVSKHAHAWSPASEHGLTSFSPGGHSVVSVGPGPEFTQHSVISPRSQNTQTPARPSITPSQQTEAGLPAKTSAAGPIENQESKFKNIYR